MNSAPRIVIAGTGSGVGKTSISIGLARALKNRGLTVQTFKVGPDFLDPTYLTIASGRPCYNLDGWMQGRKYVKELFNQKTAGADIAIIEGVMGLFDGASPESLEGSTAEMAIWLEAPAFLVVNAHGVARTIAALAKGCADFEPALNVAGVIANQSGTDRHARWLDESLKSAGAPELIGAVQRGALPNLPGRHLGLVTADSAVLSEETLESLATEIEKSLFVDRILEIASDVLEIDSESTLRTKGETNDKVRIGYAFDEAFHFYYRDNLEALESAGAELIAFSPMKDETIPGDLDALYFGGGYPEENARELSENTTMLESVREFADRSGIVYAECGGLMYLSEGVHVKGEWRPMTGILPANTKMLDKRKSLGYVEVELNDDSLWGARGAVFRGHEFHYSEMTLSPTEADGWKSVYSARKRKDDDASPEGYQKDNILASYAHLHFASRPESATHFIQRCKELKRIDRERK